MPGLLADAEPEDGGGARPRAADRFQVYPGEARGREGDAVAEQHRQYIHQDLVDEPPLQALAGHVGAEDLQGLAARSVPCRGERCPETLSPRRTRGSLRYACATRSSRGACPPLGPGGTARATPLDPRDLPRPRRGVAPPLPRRWIIRAGQNLSRALRVLRMAYGHT